jgi:disulfide bond formation protein DsbB
MRLPRENDPARQAGASALLVALGAALTLAGAWAIQLSGTPPCELCLVERYPYYAGVPVGLVAAALAASGHVRLGRIGLALLAALLLVGAGLGAYHAGVEWHLWAGPSGCTGAVNAPAKVDDFLKQLDTVKVVRCDAPALLVLGLSLAAWNALVSLALAALAAFGFWRLQPDPSSSTRSPARTVPPSTTVA